MAIWAKRSARLMCEQTFGAEGKQRTLDMVHKLEAALAQDLQQLTWMTPQTKQKALEKLHAITNKIGYPDKWRDYSALNIVRGDAHGQFAARERIRSSTGSCRRSASRWIAANGA